MKLLKCLYCIYRTGFPEQRVHFVSYPKLIRKRATHSIWCCRRLLSCIFTYLYLDYLELQQFIAEERCAFQPFQCEMTQLMNVESTCCSITYVLCQFCWPQDQIWNAVVLIFSSVSGWSSGDLEYVSSSLLFLALFFRLNGIVLCSTEN